jgi:sterol desaturase/sphingolipid hydroxylase (fatty acid hydroxylase superfamily)
MRAACGVAVAGLQAIVFAIHAYRDCSDLMDTALQQLGDQLNGWHYYILSATLCVVFFLEGMNPAVAESSERARWLHIARNIGLWLLGYLIVEWFIFSLLLGNRDRVALPGWGVATLPAWAAIIVGALVLDFVDYLSHRISHHLRPLWLLHVVHHSDTRLDGSTAVRAHPGEVLFGSVLTSLVLLSFGIPLWVFAFRASLQLPIAILHHTNWRLPARLEAALEWIFVTPAMHRLHHSPHEHETNSNYAQTFSVWDRVFGTYRNPRDAEATRDTFGLDHLRASHWQSLTGLLKTPFAARRFDRF